VFGCAAGGTQFSLCLIARYQSGLCVCLLARDQSCLLARDQSSIFVCVLQQGTGHKSLVCGWPQSSVYVFVCFTARDQRMDVVLVDTAGRMQDNEPLMKALAKVNN